MTEVGWKFCLLSYLYCQGENVFKFINVEEKKTQLYNFAIVKAFTLKVFSCPVVLIDSAREMAAPSDVRRRG